MMIQHHHGLDQITTPRITCLLDVVLVEVKQTKQMFHHQLPLRGLGERLDVVLAGVEDIFILTGVRPEQTKLRPLQEGDRLTGLAQVQSSI